MDSFDQTTTGTSNSFGLCAACGTWHVLGYGCPSTLTAPPPPPTLQIGWSCAQGHWFEAVDQQGKWLLYCRRCGEVRRLKEPA